MCNGIDLLNRTFTFQLVPIVINTMIIEVLSAYRVLWEIMTTSKVTEDIKIYVLLQESVWLMMAYSLQVTMASVGSSLSESTGETLVIVAKTLNDLEVSNDLSTKLHNFISRSQCRNLKVHNNSLFSIEWKLLVAVS